MNKYMLMALAPFLLQAELYTEFKDSRSMNQLNANINRYIEDVKITTNDINSRMLTALLDDLNSYAKIGADQYNNSMVQLQNIKNALEAKKDELYNRSSTLTRFAWALGMYPAFVSGQIDPAIKNVNATINGVYYFRLLETMTEVGYITGKVAGATALVAAGVGIGYLATNRGNSASSTHIKAADIPVAKEVEYSMPTAQKPVLQPKPSAPSRESSLPTKTLPEDEDPNGWGEDNPFA